MRQYFHETHEARTLYYNNTNKRGGFVINTLNRSTTEVRKNNSDISLHFLGFPWKC